MITAHVRIVSLTNQEALAFVKVATDVEIRVRWLPGRWRCDRCGERPWPTCPHTRALVNSDQYRLERAIP